MGMIMNPLQSHLEKYALLSLEKQEKLAGLVGEHTMELDFEAGLIRFSGSSGSPEFAFQVLGTESDNTLTWLWAWAGEQAEISAELLRSSLEMRDWGASKGITECTSPSVDINRTDGTLLSLIASEVCKAACYYQDSYDGGALFLLLFGQEIDQQPPLDAAGLMRQFSHLAALYDLNHRNALLSYLREKGLPFSERELVVTGELATGEDFRADFDPEGSLLSLNGKPIPYLT
jgi:hypothetical protein